MNSFLKISALACATALICVSVQAQQVDNAQAEIGIPMTPIVLAAPAAAPAGLTRAAVSAEMQRARAAGEMDFAYAEVNGGVLPQRGSVTASDVRQAKAKANVK